MPFPMTSPSWTRRNRATSPVALPFDDENGVLNRRRHPTSLQRSMEL